MKKLGAALAVLLVIFVMAACTPAEEMAFQGTVTIAGGSTLTMSADIEKPNSSTPGVVLKGGVGAIMECHPVDSSGILECGDTLAGFATLENGETHRPHFTGAYDGMSWKGDFALYNSTEVEPDPEVDEDWYTVHTGTFNLERRAP